MLPEENQPQNFEAIARAKQKEQMQKALWQLISNVQKDPGRQEDLETLSLMLDQLPLKAKLTSPYHKSYDAAIEVTKRDVSKNIANFSTKYNLDLAKMSDLDPVQLAKVEECFIRWVMTILRTDCIDAYRKTKRKFKRNDSNVDIYDVNQRHGLDDYIKDKQGKFTGRIDQKLGTDIAGKFTGDRLLNGIDTMIEKGEFSPKEIGKQLKDYIEQDSENKLKEFFPGTQKDCNCQVLLQLFLIEGFSMDEVYENLKCQGCKKGTIRNYLTDYKKDSSRKRKSCLNFIQEIAKSKFPL